MRALKAKYGSTPNEGTPRTYHRSDERRGGPMQDRKQAHKRGERKHKGEW